MDLWPSTPCHPKFAESILCACPKEERIYSVLRSFCSFLLHFLRKHDKQAKFGRFLGGGGPRFDLDDSMLFHPADPSKSTSVNVLSFRTSPDRQPRVPLWGSFWRALTGRGPTVYKWFEAASCTPRSSFLKFSCRILMQAAEDRPPNIDSRCILL